MHADSVKIGIDIGGTFTDGIALTADGTFAQAKTLSTHDTNPADGVMRAVTLLAEILGHDDETLLQATERFSHGTTIGTNLVVERKGTRVGLITTRGHRDNLRIMRGAGRVAGLPIDRVFDVQGTKKPEALVAPNSVLEVDERVDRHGEVLVAPDLGLVRAQLADFLESQPIDALAISLLWSFRNPVHEEQIAALARNLRPDLFLSLSSQVSPRLGEFERTVAAVLNGYIGPASRRYMIETGRRLRSRGLSNELLIMQSHGGVVPVTTAADVPLATLDSGPTGGLAAAASLATTLDQPNVVATDMGGTSFDVGLVVRGEPVLAEARVIDQYTYRSPALDVRSIACGGGSLAWIDPYTGSLRVGPSSAGSYPGPVCYGRGGTQPTVTDADLVLGLLDARGFLGGTMSLDIDAARLALAELGAQMGLSAEETAAGILRINNNNAATLIRQRTVEQGLDPREFMIYAFGGAGPVHAWGFAANLQAAGVLIPLGNGASALSAYGIASTDVLRYFDTECVIPTPFDPEEFDRLLYQLETTALKALTEVGFDSDQVVLDRIALLRYAEQYAYSIGLSLPAGEAKEWTTELPSRFTDAYSQLYGSGAVSLFHGIEAFTLRVRARVASGARPQSQSGGSTRSHHATKEVFWPDQMEWVTTSLWDGSDLAADCEVGGPAIVQLPHTSVSVPPGQRLTRDALGNLLLQPLEAK
jgi:N-methylhydantoinase A